MSLGEWKEKDWKTLIHSIQQGNCILMLGPDTAFEEVEGKTRTLTEVLANQLSKDIDPRITGDINILSLSEVSQHYVLEKKLGRTDLEWETRAFYNEKGLKYSKFHRDLAALPFYFIITSSHDSMFYEALRKENKNPLKARYHFKGKNSPIMEMGTVERPLVFYLYGTIEEADSLVLTENDLLDFLAAIISRKLLPDRIISEVNLKNKNFLFLGFGFKHWHQRMLLHVLLNQAKESRSFALERITPHKDDEFKSTVLFFQGSSSKIDIFAYKLSPFARELRERYEKFPGTPASSPEFEPENAPTVFICHASEDKEYAASLYKKIKNAGFKPWLDKEDIYGGDKWDPLIEKTIKEIDYFVVLQSKAMQDKLIGYVNEEIKYALKRQLKFRDKIKFIIPVRIDDCNNLEELEDWQYIDLTVADGIDKLFQTIRRDYYEKRGNK